jgi:hypothetical protein
MSKFNTKAGFSSKNYKSEFIASCLQIPKSRYKEISWAKEMKIMNSLVQKNNDPEFWFHARTSFPIPSLAWFLTPDGRKYLNEKYRVYNLNLNDVSPANSVCLELSREKQGEDLCVEKKKPKTLMDFIRKKQ